MKNELEWYRIFQAFLFISSSQNVLWLKGYNITKWTLKLNRLVCEKKRKKHAEHEILSYMWKTGKWSSQLKPSWTWAIADEKESWKFLLDFLFALTYALNVHSYYIKSFNLRIAIGEWCQVPFWYHVHSNHDFSLLFLRELPDLTLTECKLSSKQRLFLAVQSSHRKL